MKIFSMNDYDWMAAETLEEAVAEYNANYGGDENDDLDLPSELSDEAMDRLIFHDTEADPPVKRTFREQLNKEIAEGAKFPNVVPIYCRRIAGF